MLYQDTSKILRILYECSNSISKISEKFPLFLQSPKIFHESFRAYVNRVEHFLTGMLLKVTALFLGSFLMNLNTPSCCN